MCEHTFVTSQGHAYARFRRALATGNVRIAEDAARDLRRLSLADALALCLLYRADADRYERATARWLARFVGERPSVRLDQLELLATCLRGLAGPAPDRAAAALAAVFERDGPPELAGVVREVRAA
jgi:hypothetical protein